MIDWEKIKKRIGESPNDVEGILVAEENRLKNIEAQDKKLKRFQVGKMSYKAARDLDHINGLRYYIKHGVPNTVPSDLIAIYAEINAVRNQALFPRPESSTETDSPK